MLKVGVSNFRNAWESMGVDFEHVDEYGLGPRDSLAEAVNAVINLLGMQPCEVRTYFTFSFVLLYTVAIDIILLYMPCDAGHRGCPSKFKVTHLSSIWGIHRQCESACAVAIRT